MELREGDFLSWVRDERLMGLVAWLVCWLVGWLMEVVVVVMMDGEESFGHGFRLSMTVLPSTYLTHPS